MTPQPEDHADEGGRAIELSVEVPGTVEEVWAAIATGPGIGSWFISMEVEERAGGEVVMDWGGFGTETADVVAWEPPHRVVFRSRGDQPMAYEWLVEAGDGGSCVVRLVNSGFGEGDGWDGQYHGMTEGWKIFLQSLRLHLTHFRGRRARAVIPTVTLPGPRPAAWTALCDALGIARDATAGDRITTAPGAPELSATVEEVVASAGATAYLLLVDEPAPGTGFVAVEGDGDQVAGSVYLYLYDATDRAAPEDVGERWAAHLGTRFGAPATDALDPELTWSPPAGAAGGA